MAINDTSEARLVSAVLTPVLASAGWHAAKVLTGGAGQGASEGNAPAAPDQASSPGSTSGETTPSAAT